MSGRWKDGLTGAARCISSVRTNGRHLPAIHRERKLLRTRACPQHAYMLADACVCRASADVRADLLTPWIAADPAAQAVVGQASYGVPASAVMAVASASTSFDK